MDILIILAALMAGIVILFLFLGAGKISFKKAKAEDDVFEQMLSSEIEIEDADNAMPDPKSWKGYWLKLAIKSGQVVNNYSLPSYMAVGFAAIGAFVGLFIWPRNLIGGVALIAAALFLYRGILNYRANARIKKLENQLPALLSGMRANLQANMTPEKALLSMADDIDGPLGEELQIFRSELTVNVPLDAALYNMAQRVDSSEIKFLLASIRLAVSSGVDLDPQIEIIQKIVIQRTRIKGHLSVAVAQVQPTTIAAGVLIPAGLLYSMSSDANTAFWMSPIGFIAIGLIGVLYGAGLFITRVQIKKVKAAA